VLATVGLNPGIIEEFPDTVSQLLLLRGEDVRRQISAELGKDIEVQIPAVYEIPFVFQCRQPVIEDCERAIEAYAAKSGQIRYDAIIAGLETLRDVYLGVDASTEDASAPVKIAAIEALMKNLDTTLTQIDSFDQPLGATVDSVRRSKYVFGLAAGLLISLLILLQLTYTDSRIRSVRQLVRMVKGTSYLGAISARPHEVADRRAALTLYHCMSSTSANRVRYVPLRKSPSDDSRLRRLTDLTGKTWTMATPFADMSVSELAVSTPGEVDVLVVQRNRDLRKDLSEALAASQSSDRHLAGVLLFD
jgi:hypothetical protein